MGVYCEPAAALACFLKVSHISFRGRDTSSHFAARDAMGCTCGSGLCDLNVTCPHSLHSTCGPRTEALETSNGGSCSRGWWTWVRWGTRCPLLACRLGASLAQPPRGPQETGRRAGAGRYLRRCRGRSRSPAEGWRRLCNSPLRSPGWQGRRGRRRVLGCWPPGSLRAAPGWSLPGKRARQNSVEHCSYSGLVCRE